MADISTKVLTFLTLVIYSILSSLKRAQEDVLDAITALLYFFALPFLLVIIWF